MTEPTTLFSLNAVPWLFMAQAKGLSNKEGVMQTLHLGAQDGAINISLNPELVRRSQFPLQIDDMVLCQLTLFKATAKDVAQAPTGGILMPDKRIVRPS